MKKNNILSACIISLLSVIIILLIALPVYFTLSSARTAYIFDADQNWSKARSIAVCGKYVICKKNQFTSKSKSDVEKDSTDTYVFRLLPAASIRIIEYADEVPAAKTETANIYGRYLGVYAVKVQGYSGFLYLKESNGHMYGVFRFPGWGKGAYETLTGLVIQNGVIQFTRSASSGAELKRLGANAYFTQRFTGTFSPNLKSIKGFYTNEHQEKNMWEASR